MAELNALARERAARIARSSYGRLVALLAAPTGDIAAAEDALADAFERALLRWPEDGVPNNPEAWLLTVARNRQRDRFRSAAYRSSAPLDAEKMAVPVMDDVDFEAIPDRQLALLFVCAHPAIDPAMRTPLMLQAVLGFRAEQIAAAFAMPPTAMAQRLVRAKRRIRDAGIPFAIPGREAMPARLPEVLEAVYGAYAIDWTDVAGTARKAGLATEALSLAETLAELLPGEPEALGLAALVSLSLARAPARVDEQGTLVPTHEQDTARWDDALIERGEGYLRRAHALQRVGRFQLEAAIQSVHCNRRRSGVTDWKALDTLYAGLLEMAPTLGAKVGSALVRAEIDGAEAGLAMLDALTDSRLEDFQPAWAARAHLRARLGDTDGAAVAYERALSLCTDETAAGFLRRKASELPRSGSGFSV